MLENTESLLPIPAKRGPLKVLTVGFDRESLDEMDRLLTTLGVVSVGRMETVVRRISPATYIGSGKIEEVKRAIESCDAEAVIVDTELSPNQLRNFEKEVGKSVLDRPGVIIEIFSQHARTKEAKTQVALARLAYLLPRLAHFWTHFERQAGGGTAGRGMGEKQIEVDRRLVKHKMQKLRARLADIEKERNVQRAGRKDVLKVALVGYTNAGKSTLLNAMTQSNVLAENKLFATLDASVRSLDPFSHPPVVAIDTVGFINHLPTSLIASFRSTLEELQEADLLLHVVDGSSEHAKEQIDVVEGILKELNVHEKPRVTVLNKMDLADGGPGATPAQKAIGTLAAKNLARVAAPGAMMVSALRPDDVVRLREAVMEHFRKNLEVWEIVVPYSESRIEAMLYAHGSVEINRHLEKGTFYRLRIEEGWARKLGLEKFRL